MLLAAPLFAALLEQLLTLLARILALLEPLLLAILAGLQLGNARRAEPGRDRDDRDRHDRHRDQQGADQLPGLGARHRSARKSPAEVSHVTASRPNTEIPSRGSSRLSRCQRRITAIFRASTTSNAI